MIGPSDERQSGLLVGRHSVAYQESLVANMCTAYCSRAVIFSCNSSSRDGFVRPSVRPSHSLKRLLRRAGKVQEGSGRVGKDREGSERVWKGLEESGRRLMKVLGSQYTRRLRKDSLLKANA
jgi:hypothetical protein